MAVGRYAPLQQLEAFFVSETPASRIVTGSLNATKSVVAVPGNDAGDARALGETAARRHVSADAPSVPSREAQLAQAVEADQDQELGATFVAPGILRFQRTRY